MWSHEDVRSTTHVKSLVLTTAHLALASLSTFGHAREGNPGHPREVDRGVARGRPEVLERLSLGCSARDWPSGLGQSVLPTQISGADFPARIPSWGPEPVWPGSARPVRDREADFHANTKVEKPLCREWQGRAVPRSGQGATSHFCSPRQNVLRALRPADPPTTKGRPDRRACRWSCMLVVPRACSESVQDGRSGAKRGLPATCVLKKRAQAHHLLRPASPRWAPATRCAQIAGAHPAPATSQPRPTEIRALREQCASNNLKDPRIQTSGRRSRTSKQGLAGWIPQAHPRAHLPPRMLVAAH